MARGPRVYLGSAIADALARVGITEQAVSALIGRPCGCAARRRRLDQWSEWAERVLAGEDVPPPGDVREKDKGGS